MSDTSGPAFPGKDTVFLPGVGGGDYKDVVFPGLTKREYAAIKIAGRKGVKYEGYEAAAGRIRTDQTDSNDRRKWAKEVLAEADALLAALSEEKPT